MAAESERSRKAQMLDYLNMQQRGYKELFYDPAEVDFNRAMEFGQTPETPVAPTWEDFQSDEYQSRMNPYKPL